MEIAALFRQQRKPIPPATDFSGAEVLPAENLIIEVRGDPVPSSVTLDGRTIALIRDEQHSRGHFLLNAFGSVGFHRLEVQNSSFYFATEDAKLRLVGIQQLLDFLDEEGLSWGNQLFFADGSAIRHPKVDFAWLVGAAPELLASCQQIVQRPSRRRVAALRKGRPSHGRIQVAATLRNLRGRGVQLLEAHPEGLLEAEGKRYLPRIAVTASQQSTVDTLSNRRATALLRSSRALCVGLAGSGDLPRPAKEVVGDIRLQLEAMLREFPFSSLTTASRLVSPAPDRQERIDPKYETTFRLYNELTNERGWDPNTQLAPRHAYVRFAEELFEAFVALVIARAFETSLTTRNLTSGLSFPAFESDAYGIYYDTQPPEEKFANWRSGTSRPSAMRPDLCIVDRLNNVGILADAKYRVTNSGRVPGGALQECQVYMQSFGQPAVAVFYPGPGPLVERITAHSMTILEVSLGPFSGLEAYVSSDVRPALESLMEPLLG
jgi:hypothetical protein